MMKKSLLFVTLGLFSVMSIWAMANPTDKPLPTYQVEVIVFSHINAADYHSEQWPLIDPLAVRSQFGFQLKPEAIEKYQQTSRFYPLTADHLSLNQIAAKLDKTTGYQVLLHLGWQQHILPSAATEPIHIYGGNELTNQGDNQGFNSSESEDYNTTNNWQVDGQVAINLKRYFNVNFNLLFAIPSQQLPIDADSPWTSSDMSYFHLVASRRMKSRELNYIDYPLFGIFIEITPVKNPLNDDSNRSTPQFKAGQPTS